MQMSDIHQQLFKNKSLQMKSIIRLYTFFLVDFISFKQNSVLIPDELQIDNDDTMIFSSSAYVYFLSFLCHYHLQNVRECYDSLCDLKLVISENYLESVRYANDYLLGVALQLLGDTLIISPTCILIIT